MCVYHYSAHFTDADIEFTKKGILRNPDFSRMLIPWFALWGLTPAESNTAESQAPDRQP